MAKFLQPPLLRFHGHWPNICVDLARIFAGNIPRQQPLVSAPRDRPEITINKQLRPWPLTPHLRLTRGPFLGHLLRLNRDRLTLTRFLSLANNPAKILHDVRPRTSGGHEIAVYCDAAVFAALHFAKLVPLENVCN